MLSLRTWRTAAATLLLVALATTSTTAAASARTPGHQQAHYCKQVDAYRIRTCAEALLPAGPLGRQLRWELAQVTGGAATLTEAEVRAHFSAEFLSVMIYRALTWALPILVGVGCYGWWRRRSWTSRPHQAQRGRAQVTTSPHRPTKG